MRRLFPCLPRRVLPRRAFGGFVLWALWAPYALAQPPPLLDQRFNVVTPTAGLVLGVPPGATRSSLAAIPLGHDFVASGNSQTTATPLTGQLARIISGTGGVVLPGIPAWPDGAAPTILVINGTAVTQVVWPPNGSAIGGLASGAPATLGPGALAWFWGLGALWLLVGPGPLPLWAVP